MLNTLNGLFIAAVLAGTPLLLGALGEILTEKSGNLNLGVEGMMFMGAITGLAGSYYYEQAVIGSGGNPNGAVSSVIALLTSFAAGSLGALIYSFLTITLRANQNVTGLTLTIFGTGFGNFFGEYIGQKAGGYVAVSEVTKKAFSGIDIPVLSDIPVLGPLLFRYNWVVYFAIAAALFMTWFFNRTRVGLNLRAVGEDPATADAAGINTTVYKYMATVIGGGICVLGQLIQNGWIDAGLSRQDAGTATSCSLVALSALLTGLNLYNRLARFGGAGTLVPITGFANAVVSPAIDFKSEGFVTGMAAKMFQVAGPVIVFGTLASVLYGVVLMLLG